MILRKPYAFLIKYFKIIHIIMFLIFGYFIFVFRSIYVFLINYAKTGNYTYIEGMVNNYVPIYLFLLVILVMVLSIFTYSLMKEKEKPILFYRILIIYCVVLLVGLGYFYFFFASINTKTYSPLQLVISRDIMAFIFLVNFFYVAFTFARGFGFDIKKFSFEQDKKLLNISDTDSEEFELNIGIDKDKINSYINKEKREFKNYLRENSIVLLIVGTIMFLGLVFFLYDYFFVEHKVYKENSVITVSNVDYQIKESYLTNKDKYSTVISDNYKFIIVNLDINNHTNNTINLKREMFRLKIGDNYYYPDYSFKNSFDDLGEIFVNNPVKGNTKKNYYMVFKILDSDEGKASLEILTNAKNNLYNNVTLNPVVESHKTINTEIKKEFKINDNAFMIEEYLVTSKSYYSYEECLNNKCTNYIKTVTPSLNNLVMYVKIKNVENETEAFLNSTIGLVVDNKEISSKEVKLLVKNKDMLYLEVPRTLSYAKKIYLTMKTRNAWYVIDLGENNE